MSLGFGVVQLDVSVVNVAVKSIGHDVGGSVSGLQWVVNAYTVAFAAFILSAGALGDRVGAKRVFVSGFVVFTLASVACGLAPGLGFLIGARAIQGIGAAVLVPCSLTLLNHSYADDTARARAVGLWAAGASVALSAGPLVGGLLIASLGWRAIFFINVPLGLIAIMLSLAFADETPPSKDRSLDLPGQSSAVIALAALAAAMVAGGQRGFVDPFVIVGFGIAAAAAAAFILIESRRSKPMLSLGLFHSRGFAISTSIGLVINVAFYGLIFVLSLYFQSSLHYSPLQTGLAFAPATAAVLATNLSASRIARAIGTRVTLALAGTLAGAGAAGLTLAADNTPYLELVAQLIVLGLALGLVVPLITSTQLNSVEANQSGIAAGTLNTARQAGSVIGVALFGALAATDLIHGLRLSLLICVVLAVFTVALSLAIRGDAS